MGRRVQRRAKGLVVKAACEKPDEMAEQICSLILRRLPGGRAREAESFWWFASEGHVMSCPNTHGDDLAAAEYLRVLREVSRELPDLSFEVGFEPIVYERMRLQAGSFGDDEDEVRHFIEHG
jgi:hypothetical protein